MGHRPRRAELVGHEVAQAVLRKLHLAPSEALQIGKARMRADAGAARQHEGAELLELFDDWVQLLGDLGAVPDRVGRQLVRGVRHEGALIRPGTANNLQEVGSRVSFNVELDIGMRAGQPR